jgi:hypothetical protein
VPVQLLQVVHRAVDHQTPGVALELNLQRTNDNNTDKYNQQTAGPVKSLPKYIDDAP